MVTFGDQLIHSYPFFGVNNRGQCPHRFQFHGVVEFSPWDHAAFSTSVFLSNEQEGMSRSPGVFLSTGVTVVRAVRAERLILRSSVRFEPTGCLTRVPVDHENAERYGLDLTLFVALLFMPRFSQQEGK